MVSKAFIGSLVLLALILWVCPAQAQSYSSGVVVTSLSPVRGKIQKHFDINKDHILNFYERSLYQMYLHFHFPLATDKKMLFFDDNKNLMLEPYEYKKYLVDKQAHFKTYRMAVAQNRARMRYRQHGQGRRL